MKRLLLVLLLFLGFTSVFSQLDREHWFAPMYDGQSNTGDYQYLHLSTNETTPFVVSIYNNNTLIRQVTISKGNPATETIARSYIITANATDLFRVRTLGLYVKGDRPFFANLRFGMTNHAEIITSKGTAGIGTDFYTVVAPNYILNSGGSVLGFSASFLATEDNTTVTVSNFKKTLLFTNGSNATSFTFTLNKGQSYIIDGRSANNNNKDGFIGAKVVSDKPITMSNGNFNGQFSTVSNSGSGSDILMDQSVPVDKLGDEFVVVKGHGQIGNRMEGAIVVATESNTEVYINDDVTPAAVLANAGDYYYVSETSYVARSSIHYNLHLRTSKNVYVFQLLGGVQYGDSPLATGGMNYIPPLNCYLPKKIDEIGNIDRIGYTNYNAKLNIITEKGAVVTVNGVTPNVIYGPFDISNIEAEKTWVTYSIPNITGNVTVVSDKAVTAGIAAGNGAVGYGGYFAGFSSIPLVLKREGDCLPDVKLEVTEGFNSYEWLMKVGATYVPAPGVNNLNIYQPTQAGIYAVKIQQGSCPEVQTADYKFFNCNTYTNYDYQACSTQLISPSFVLSTQTPNPSSIAIVNQPTKGTVTIAADGTITYTANPNATGTDTFRYSFCGANDIPDCETVQATIQLNQIVHQDALLQECATNGVAVYNLTNANVSSDTGITKTYYQTQNGAENQIAAEVISNPTNFSSADRFVYVRITNSFGCVAIAAIELKAKLSPIVQENLYTRAHCDDEIDGVIDGIFFVNLNEIAPIVLTNPTLFTVKYYLTQPDAIANGTNNITGNFSFTANTSIWIRVDSPDDCPPVIRQINLITGSKMTLIAETNGTVVCDNDVNGSESILLSNYIPLFSTATGLTTTYFTTLANAQDNVNPVTDAQTISSDRTFYYRFSLPGFCDAIGTLNISFKASTPPALLTGYTTCEGGSIPLDAGSGYISYEWSNGALSQATTLSEGTYWVKVTNADGCIYTHNFTINAVPEAQLNIAAFNGLRCDDNLDGIIEVNLATDVTSVVLANASQYTVKYYTSQPFAQAGGTNNLSNNWSYNTPTTIWIRVESTYCPPIIEQISFGFSSTIALDETVNTQTVCDDNLNGSKQVNLNSYIPLFTSVVGATGRYFNTIQDARNNVNTINATQTISADRTIYMRLSATGVCADVVTLNLLFRQGTASTLLEPTYPVCHGDQRIVGVEAGFSTILWSNGATSQTTSYGAGTHWVDLTNEFGCKYHQTFTISNYPIAQPNVAAYNGLLCDEDFDGVIHVQFSTQVTPVILPNSNLYTVKYYTTSAFAQAGGTNNLADNWSYNNPRTLYIRIESPYCPTLFETINFGFGASVPLLDSMVTDELCDEDENMLDGFTEVNLSVFKTRFTTDNAVQLSYFESENDAHQNTNELSNPVTFSGTKTFYIRFSKNNVCTSIGTLTLTIKVPKVSDMLEDQPICPGTTTTLDVGPGFDSYVWSTGEADQPITVGVGEYWVDLVFNGCRYRQFVNVTEVEVPVINSVEIQGTTVTINATGGTPPYRYSLDGITYQDSNVFTNVPYGENTAYVISADDCAPSTQIFTVIRLLNVITPNGDGYNDYLNYSDLNYKDDVMLKVFDRNGALIFTGEKSNNYTWDGKMQGRPVATSSYWYILQWRDPGTTFVTKTQGWVLVKNRE